MQLVKKKLSKIVGLKKHEFNEFIRQKDISVVRTRLIPLQKAGDEIALTSVLLSGIRLVDEYRGYIFSQLGLRKGGKAYFYTEVAFKEFPEARIDGMILVVSAGKIKDAAIMEIKNGRDKLTKAQIEKYQMIARRYSIGKFFTVSNEFVTEPSQTPVAIRKLKSLDMFHFSWSYLLTVAHLFLYKNNMNISDEDQIEIMREVVQYLESEKVGVLGFQKMAPEWTVIADKVTKREQLSQSSAEIVETVRSWQQQERDMALRLSRKIGSLVECGSSRFKGDLQSRLENDIRSLASSGVVSSVFRVRGAASDIRTDLFFDKRTIEMNAVLRAPEEKTLKGKLGWLKRQFDTAIKKSPSAFSKTSKHLLLEIGVKGSRRRDRVSLSQFESVYDTHKGCDLREFKIILIRDLGSRFSSATQFVKHSDEMLSDFYEAVVQHLTKWEPLSPKVPKAGQDKNDDESFIEQINSGKKDSIVSSPVAPADWQSFLANQKAT